MSDSKITPAGGRDDREPGRSPNDLPLVVGVVNVVAAGLGGLYLSTHSIVVTVVGAVLAAVLTLSVLLNKRRVP